MTSLIVSLCAIVSASAPQPTLVKVNTSASLPVGPSPLKTYVVERQLAIPSWYRVWIRPEHLKDLQADPRVQWTEPDAHLHFETPSEEPSLIDQWGLENAPTWGGLWDADVDALDAWEQGATGSGVLIALIDSGVELNHPDLTNALWTNSAEIPDNGIDDDENGWIDDIHGIRPHDPSSGPTDREGHGTQCAGIIVAQPNQLGVIGLAPDARLLVIGMSYEDDAFISHAIDGIRYSVDHGAQILSASWTTGLEPSLALREALEYAEDNDVLSIFAAGNSPLNSDLSGFYPAKYDLETLISVGASNRLDQRVHMPGVWGSAYGLESVDLNAPGEGILSTQIGGSYEVFDGTSAATPFVAAAAALVWSSRPDLSALEVKNILLDSVDPTLSTTVSGGRLNAGSAVRLAQEGLPPLHLVITGPSEPERAVSRTYEVPNAPTELRWFFSDTGEVLEGNPVSHTFMTPGSWSIVVEGSEANGQQGHASRAVQIPIPWRDVPDYTLDSPHPLTARIHPFLLDFDDAVWVRLHFQRIDTFSTGFEQGDDFLAIIGADAVIPWSISGSHESLWSAPLFGGKHLLNAVHSTEHESWGFRIDRVQTWDPSMDVVPTERPDEGPEEAPGTCGTAPHATLIWPLFLILGWTRRRA